MVISAGDGRSLLVSVVAEYDPPSSFTFEPPSYRAASALNLTCQVEGNHSGLFYEWTSTCLGNCFTQLGFAGGRSVSTPYLRSYDTGVHTCMVYDSVGCTGKANITVNVVGEPEKEHSWVRKGRGGGGLWVPEPPSLPRSHAHQRGKKAKGLY